MKKQTDIQHTNRRTVLQITGLGILGGMVGNWFSPRTAQAVPAVAYTSWIHGHSMRIEYPERIASELRTGFCIQVDGKPGTENWFHFAIPTPTFINDNKLKVGSVMLRFRTLSADALVKHIHVYDGETKIAQHNNINFQGDRMFERFDVPGHPAVNWGLGISIGVGFGGIVSMSHRMEFIAAGCDFLV
jgi:hypothetical protein